MVATGKATESTPWRARVGNSHSGLFPTVFSSASLGFERLPGETTAAVPRGVLLDGLTATFPFQGSAEQLQLQGGPRAT